jgi:hypothetical protein
MDAVSVSACLNSLKENKSTLRTIILDGFVSNPFEPDTLFQQQKRVARKCRSLLKFLIAQKDLF